MADLLVEADKTAHDVRAAEKRTLDMEYLVTEITKLIHDCHRQDAQIEEDKGRRARLKNQKDKRRWQNNIDLKKGFYGETLDKLEIMLTKRRLLKHSLD